MRDHALMGVTTAARTAVALGTLLILARTLGPSDFGFISIVITWSTIVALVTDYGFGMRALRDIGAERERGWTPGWSTTMISMTITVGSPRLSCSPSLKHRGLR